MHLKLAQTSTSSVELFMEVNCRSEKLRVHECFEFCILLGQKIGQEEKVSTKGTQKGRNWEECQQG